MAFAITVQGSASAYADDDIAVGGLPFSTATPGIQLADVTWTTTRAVGATQTLPAPCTAFRFVLSIKTLIVGANTDMESGPLFYLEVADNSAMSTNLTALTPIIQGINIASATEPQFHVIHLRVSSAPKGFVRIICDPTLMGAGSSGTYDALIVAT
jgi:hypothetical protein